MGERQAMVRLSDLAPADAQHLLSKDCPQFETEPFVGGPELSDRRLRSSPRLAYISATRRRSNCVIPAIACFRASFRPIKS